MSKNDDEVLVRVEGVSKKFCRSLKKSLWYGVCDIALGAGFHPELTGREPEGWEARRTSNRRLARRAQRRREGASQNITINGSVLGLTKKEPERRAAWRKGAAGRPGGIRDSGEARTKSTRRSTRSSTLPRFGNSSTCRCRVILRR